MPAGLPPYRSLRETVLDELIAEIARGDLQPGSRMPEAELAARFGVSRNPVREALHDLDALGLVRVEPRKGATVAALDPVELIELLEVRAVLEGYVAELAAERRDGTDIETLERCVRAGSEAAARGDVVDADRYYREFLTSIDRAARNRQLAEILTPIRRRTDIIHALLDPGHRSMSWDEHAIIVECIRAGDAAGARHASGHHLQEVRGRVEQRFA